MSGRFVVCAMVMSACASEPDEFPGTVVDVGAVHRPVLAPLGTRAGEPFVVSVTTAGDGCTRFHSTDVDVDDDTVTITPYDHIALPTTFCTRELTWVTHDVRLQLYAGVKRVRVYTRFRRDEPIALAFEQDVTVE